MSDMQPGDIIVIDPAPGWGARIILRAVRDAWSSLKLRVRWCIKHRALRNGKHNRRRVVSVSHTTLTVGKP